MESLAPLAPFYFFIYWFFVLVLTFSQYNNISKQSYIVVARKFDYRPIILLSAFIVLFFGLRPTQGVAQYFGDTVNYAASYEWMSMTGRYSLDDKLSSDWLFHIIQYQCSQSIDVHLFFLLMMFLYVVLAYIGCKKIDISHGALLMLFWFGSFQFFPYAVNGVRNGIACSIIILAVAYLCKRKLILAAICSFIAFGFHKSVFLPIVTMSFSYYVRKPKYMYATWIAAIAVSLVIGEQIADFLSLFSVDDRLINNLYNDDADGQILEHRFRWDFLLYSFMPILLGWYVIFKRKFFNKTYLVLLGTYIYANSFWVLAIRAMFSNRIAYLSWFIYPVVLAYPLLNFQVFKKGHNKKTALILLAHFGFTTILWILG